MNEASNKIVVGVLAVLVVLLAVLLASAGSCAPSGGGGASPAASSGASTPTESTSESLLSDDSSAEQDVQDMSIEEFKQLLSEDNAPVGSNPRSAYTSNDVTTAAQTYESIRQRGFKDIEIWSDFDIDGTYVGTVTIDESSSSKYPSYKAFYVSDKNVTWLVYVNCGKYAAVPLGDSDGALSKSVILAESDTITQYDGMKNEYSDFDLAALAGVTGVKVAKIDKATLDSYSTDDLNRM